MDPTNLEPGLGNPEVVPYIVLATPEKEVALRTTQGGSTAQPNVQSPFIDDLEDDPFVDNGDATPALLGGSNVLTRCGDERGRSNEHTEVRDDKTTSPHLLSTPAPSSDALSTTSNTEDDIYTAPPVLGSEEVSP